MTLNEIALAFTAYLLVKWGNRVAENDNIDTLTAIVVVLTNIPANIPAILYLLYFMGRSVLCYFGE